jgi:phthalate 4,5-cis-dihydrodiol dehydrogenase
MVGRGSPELRMAIIGLGNAGCMMLPAMVKNPRVKLVAAADLDKPSLEKFQQDFQAEVYENVEALCENANVDAIYISTPTQLHTEHVIMALEHGKHVITEKPMALTLEDADAMIAASQRNSVHLVVGHSHSFETPIQRITEIVRSGELGPVRMMNNWYFTSWLYNPRNREELDTSLGGGVTFRQGSHQFDIIRMIGGGLVRSVRAMPWVGRRPSHPRQPCGLPGIRRRDTGHRGVLRIRQVPHLRDHFRGGRAGTSCGYIGIRQGPQAVGFVR